MIVKDEAPVIRRCLESVRSLIDTWVIVDTGSSDGTQDVIREVYSDVPGVLYERSWKGFDGSRTEAIELARSSGDYLLFMDADDVMEVEPGFRMPELTHDGYSIAVHHGPVIHWRPTLAATRLPWRYMDVLHEYLYCDSPFTLGALQGIHMRIVGGGGRQGKESVQEKYRRDAEMLQQALVKEPGNYRYVFYLGQSWDAAGEPEKALEAYDRRATMGGWDQELFWACLYGARLAELLQRPLTDVMARFYRAHQIRPSRAEALGELARLCRVNGRRWDAYKFARQAALLPRPIEAHFVEYSWYDWRALDELAVSAYRVGEYSESKRCCEQLLHGDKLPAQERDRVSRNLEAAQRKLGSRVLVGPEMV
ncbi:glycosyl transferase [Streptomyces sp. Ru72]|nr:glycosyl transferase [Streptomyces sp. Ru72]